MAHLTRGLVLALLGAAIAACGGAARESGHGRAQAPGKAGEYVSSNTRFADYAGTRACARCHPGIVEQWLAAPMHNMTRALPGAHVEAPFDGRVFSFHGDSARLETSGRDRFVTIESKRYGSGTYRVTRVIGGHHREDYAGVRVAAVREGAPALGDETEERVMPVSWLIEPKTLRYKGYSVMVKERDGLKAGSVWNQTCIFCHNTVPYLSTVIGGLAGAGGYQGEVVDPLLPPPLRASYVVTDDEALGRDLAAELRRLGAEASSPTLREAIATTRSRFRAGHLVEVGIGCESCHLGAAEHVRSPAVRPSFEPISDAFAVRLKETAPAARRAAVLNRVCARCHQVLFSGYDATWEGGTRRGAPGGSNINSGEARDMMLGGCVSQMTCVDCHDPHAPGATAALRALPAEKEDALCTKCHTELASGDAQRAHTHHDPAGKGARCLACHMPRKNMALDGSLTRYHRVGSPNDMTKVLRDRPIECALCHADKTVLDLVTTMERWWKRPLERGALEKLYGSLDANVVVATAARGKPHEQAVAFQVLGEARPKGAAAILAGQLTHPYPIVRGYAKRALDAVVGSPVPIDIDAEDEAIEAQSRRYR